MTPTAPTTVPARQHDYETHADHDPGSQMCRFICDGGLSCCKTCGGAEGSLPTECPGERMTIEQAEYVFAGWQDYRAGAWIELPAMRS